MKVAFIVANWKSNKVLAEVDQWISQFSSVKVKLGVKVIVCPSYVYLPRLKQVVEEGKLDVFLGSQDVSPFESGAYTGEVNGLQIKDYAEYVLVGHSERRKKLEEKERLVEEKLTMALKYGLTPIFFVQDENALIPDKNIPFIVYEPPSSISPGPVDNPENAENVAKLLKEKNPMSNILYGGNVTSENVQNFMKMEHLDGVIVGKASLDPVEFGKIVNSF